MRNIAQNTVLDSSDDDGVIIDVTSTAVLAANKERTNALITNISNERIFLARGKAAEMYKGIPLNPNGGSYEIGLHNMFRGAINAICASGSKKLSTSEGS